MYLSKAFFSVIKRALNEAAWKRSEIALVDSVEQELKALYRDMYPTGSEPYIENPVEIPPYSPIKYTPAPKLSPESTVSPQVEPLAVKKVTKAGKNKPKKADVPVANGNPGGMSASPEGMAAIDMMIKVGLEQARTAPARERALLRNVKVDSLPETADDWENNPLI